MKPTLINKLKSIGKKAVLAGAGFGLMYNVANAEEKKLEPKETILNSKGNVVLSREDYNLDGVWDSVFYNEFREDESTIRKSCYKLITLSGCKSECTEFDEKSRPVYVEKNKGQDKNIQGFDCRDEGELILVTEYHEKTGAVKNELKVDKQYINGKLTEVCDNKKYDEAGVLRERTIDYGCDGKIESRAENVEGVRGLR